MVGVGAGGVVDDGGAVLLTRYCTTPDADAQNFVVSVGVKAALSVWIPVVMNVLVVAFPAASTLVAAPIVAESLVNLIVPTGVRG